VAKAAAGVALRAVANDTKKSKPIIILPV
jgi:hypothetical protein